MLTKEINVLVRCTYPALGIKYFATHYLQNVSVPNDAYKNLRF